MTVLVRIGYGLLADLDWVMFCRSCETNLKSRYAFVSLFNCLRTLGAKGFFRFFYFFFAGGDLGGGGRGGAPPPPP